MNIAGLLAIVILSSIPAAFGAYVEPTQQEQSLFDLLKSEFEKLSVPKKDVSETLNSFSTPISYYFPCDQGDTYNSINATVQTRLAKFDSSIAHQGGAITGGIYVWKCTMSVQNGKMNINCNNELMLNSAALTQNTDKDPIITKAENLVVFYHELLHGQLMIDSIQTSDSWQDYTCKTQIKNDLDYTATDADHQVVTPLQTEFAKRLIEDDGGIFKVQEITPDQTSSGAFSQKIGSLYDYPQYVKSGINVSARSYNVADLKITSQKNDIFVSGTLNDKARSGIVWLYVFGKEDTTQKTTNPVPEKISIPNWVKDLAKWWSDGAISDSEFINGIKYMIENNIITIPQTTQGTKSSTIPSWVKNSAKFWYDGKITDKDFASGIQYLIKSGIIQVQADNIPTMSSEISDEKPITRNGGTIKASSSIFPKQSYQNTMAQLTGKIDDFKTGTYVIITITRPDGTSYDLKGILTNKGIFTIPIMIDSGWQQGQYDILMRYNGMAIDSTEFSIR